MTFGSAKGQEQQKKKDELEQLLERARATSRRQAAAATPAERREESPDARRIRRDHREHVLQDHARSGRRSEAEDADGARALAYADNKEEARERLEEFKRFKEYLQFERKRMAQQIIELTDTEAFAELKSVYDELNNALLSFEERIAPLTEIVDAVYTLRMNGLTFDAFKEIVLDKEAETRLAALRAQQEADYKRLSDEISTVNERNAVLGEDKAFFGLGGTKKTAREEIAKNQLVLEQKKQELSDLTGKISEIAQASPRESQLGDEFVSGEEQAPRAARYQLGRPQAAATRPRGGGASVRRHHGGASRRHLESLRGHGQADQQSARCELLDARDLCRVERRYQGGPQAQ